MKVGDEVTVLTPGHEPRNTTVVGIDFAGRSLGEAAAPQSVALRLADELDIARGDTIAAAGTVREAFTPRCAGFPRSRCAKARRSW